MKNKFKDYLKRTRHHLHAIVGITGGFLACLSLSWVWLGYFCEWSCNLLGSLFKRIIILKNKQFNEYI